MDQNQKRYAMKRVDDVMNSKLSELRQKFTTKGKGPSDKAMLQAIRDSEVVLQRYRSITLHTPLGEAFDFSQVEVQDVFDEVGFRKAETALRKESDAVRDEIMLGTDAEAKRLIAKFCGKE